MNNQQAAIQSAEQPHGAHRKAPNKSPGLEGAYLSALRGQVVRVWIAGQREPWTITLVAWDTYNLYVGLAEGVQALLPKHALLLLAPADGQRPGSAGASEPRAPLHNGRRGEKESRP